MKINIIKLNVKHVYDWIVNDRNSQFRNLVGNDGSASTKANRYPAPIWIQGDIIE